MVRVFAVVAAIAMSVSAVVEAQPTTTTNGEIVSVRLIPRTITVRRNRTQEVARYYVPTGTSITVAGGEARLGHLRAGDRVNVSYRETDLGLEAVRIRVPEATSVRDQRIAEGLFSTVTGEIVGLNAEQGTLTLVGDQSGERLSYAVPATAGITVQGESAQLANLRVGDVVTLRFRQEIGEPEVVRILLPETDTPLPQRPAN